MMSIIRWLDVCFYYYALRLFPAFFFVTESDNPSPLDVGSVEVEEGLRLPFYLFILFIFLFPVVFSMSPGCQG